MTSKYLYFGLTVILYTISTFMVVLMIGSVMPLAGIIILTFGGRIALASVHDESIPNLPEIKWGLLCGSITSVILLVVLFFFLASKIQC